MKRLRLFLVVIFLIIPFYNSFAQVARNLKSLEGTWTGQWFNTTYSSSGSISVTLTVNETNQTANANWVIGGNILGVPGGTSFSNDITINSSANTFTVSFHSNVWGDISGTGYLNTGAYSGQAVNCPNTNVLSETASGTFTNTAINGRFDFQYYGSQTAGTSTITKQVVIATPTSLTVNENPKGTINLTWQDNATNETGFRIDRKNQATGAWTEIGTASANATSFQDKNVTSETNYVYRVAAYNSTTESEYSSEATIKTTFVESSIPLPSDYLLSQNYPNPFNPSTLIRFEVPRDSKIKITVHTLLGEDVTTLFNGIKNIGQYELKFDAKNYPSGIYLIKMVAQSLESGNKFIDVKKMILLK